MGGPDIASSGTAGSAAQVLRLESAHPPLRASANPPDGGLMGADARFRAQVRRTLLPIEAMMPSLRPDDERAPAAARRRFGPGSARPVDDLVGRGAHARARAAVRARRRSFLCGADV